MSAAVLTDALGPRGRRRVRIGSAIAAVVLAALVALALWQFGKNGQLQPSLYTDLFQPAAVRLLAGALLTNLNLAAVAMTLSIIIGAALALARLSRSSPLRLVSGTYVQFFRAMPVLLLILFSRFGLPDLGITLSDFTYVVLALVAYNSATLGEIFRAGILSLDRGQSEAAYAVGMTYWQAMGSVILPQAVRRMVPAIVSQLVTLLKDTSLAYIIALPELLRVSQFVGARLRNELQALMLAAAVFIIINYGLSRLARVLEARQRRRLGAGAIEVAGGPEDLTVTEEELAARKG
jgi:glutamate transport system permease protein